MLEGIIIGFVSLITIGLFHPIVIKGEYYFGVKMWPVLLLSGLGFLVLSYFSSTIMLSAIWGIVGFTCLWSILELFHQRERVRKGWFPANENRK